MNPSPLHYLDFDYSEDADGNGTFDALASVPPAHQRALQAEVAAVLAWAHQEFPDRCDPDEHGGCWQFDLHGSQEVTTPLLLGFDPSTGMLGATEGVAGPARTTIRLTVSGDAGFCAQFREQFGVN